MFHLLDRLNARGYDNSHHILGDRFGEPSLLPLGFSRPKLHNDMRHVPVSAVLYLRYCSSLTCSIHSTTLPSFFS